MITRLDLENQRELIQDDLSCILDGIKDYDRILTNADQAIVDRFEVLLAKVDESCQTDKKK